MRVAILRVNVTPSSRTTKAAVVLPSAVAKRLIVSSLRTNFRML
jgi:hypothetical protein